VLDGDDPTLVPSPHQVQKTSCWTVFSTFKTSSSGIDICWSQSGVHADALPNNGKRTVTNLGRV